MLRRLGLVRVQTPMFSLYDHASFVKAHVSATCSYWNLNFRKYSSSPRDKSSPIPYS
ncbi:hypothetical protein PGB90_007933 [Kerria lacca]